MLSIVNMYINKVLDAEDCRLAAMLKGIHVWCSELLPALWWLAQRTRLRGTDYLQTCCSVIRLPLCIRFIRLLLNGKCISYQIASYQLDVRLALPTQYVHNVVYPISFCFRFFSRNEKWNSYIGTKCRNSWYCTRFHSCWWRNFTLKSSNCSVFKSMWI